jgi:DNA mismatch endonuclease (patch repair protein)
MTTSDETPSGDQKDHDIVSEEKRSEMMSKVRSENTAPEQRARSLLSRMGYRFQLHQEELPGKPDLVLPEHDIAVFVHGCFWHMHSGCDKATIPKSNTEFWREKLTGNVSRDKRVISKLTDDGWRVLVLWECELEDNIDQVAEKVEHHLSSDRSVTGYP